MHASARRRKVLPSNRWRKSTPPSGAKNGTSGNWFCNTLPALFCCAAITLLASGVSRAATVYWTDGTSNTLSRINSDGTDPTLLSASLNNARSLATDGTHLYYGNNGTNQIIRAALDGSGATPLLSATPSAMLVTPANIYYTTWTGGVFRSNKDGTAITNLVTGGIAGGNSSGYFGIAVTPVNVFFSNYLDGKVYRSGLDGSGVTTLVTGITNPSGLAVSDTHLFIGASDNSAVITRTDLTGANATTFGTPGNYYQLSIVDQTLYYSTAQNTLGKIGLDGSGQAALYTSGVQVMGVAAIAVPEPATFALAGVAAFAVPLLVARRHAAARRCPVACARLSSNRVRFSFVAAVPSRAPPIPQIATAPPAVRGNRASVLHGRFCVRRCPGRRCKRRSGV